MIHWIEKDNKLIGEFLFKDFSQAWAFMSEVAMLAEKQNHHPEWTNIWNSVRIKLSTHDAGNMVTDKDRKLAESINRVFDRYQDYT